MSEDNKEQVPCPRCANLQGIRERCGVCNQVGFIMQEREPGHHTLSDERARRVKNPQRYGLGGDVGPKTTDPLWAGAEQIKR